MWEKSGAWPQLVEAMRLSLETRTPGGRDPWAFAALPGLCCAAAGGDFAWADPVAAAWLAFYTAAHLMDSLEDQDEPDAWWAELGPGAALNAATGLFFSATLALHTLNRLPLEPDTIEEATALALQPFLRMSSGQYAGFLAPPRTLDEYWRIASAKSGEFFALACRAGARLGTARPEALEGFGQFGMQAGLLVQILDDLADYRDLMDLKANADLRGAASSLPALYIQEVCPELARDHFAHLLQNPDPQARQALARFLEDHGAGFYLLAELETHRSLALKSLEAAAVDGPARQALAGLLRSI